MTFKRGDFVWLNGTVGTVTRQARDGSWVDVEWHNATLGYWSKRMICEALARMTVMRANEEGQTLCPNCESVFVSAPSSFVDSRCWECGVIFRPRVGDPYYITRKSDQEQNGTYRRRRLAKLKRLTAS